MRERECVCERERERVCFCACLCACVRRGAQKTEVENGGGGVFFSYVSLKQIHKHTKLCISMFITCCKQEHEFQSLLASLLRGAFHLVCLPDTTHTLQIKSPRPRDPGARCLGLLSAALSEGGKQGVCCQSAGHHLSLIAHESRGNGSVIAP